MWLPARLGRPASSKLALELLGEKIMRKKLENLDNWFFSLHVAIRLVIGLLVCSVLLLAAGYVIGTTLRASLMCFTEGC